MVGRLFAKRATIIPCSVPTPLCNVTLWLILSRDRVLVPWVWPSLMTCFNQENEVEVLVCHFWAEASRNLICLCLVSWDPCHVNKTGLACWKMSDHIKQRGSGSAEAFLSQPALALHICPPLNKLAVTVIADTSVNPDDTRRIIQLNPAQTADPQNCEHFK